MEKPRIFRIPFAKIYPLYLEKAERKDRSQAEVDEIIYWLTGYNEQTLKTQLDKGAGLETFFVDAPKLNPARKLVTGMICGVRVEEIKEPIMQEIRYLDKLIDELAHGKSMDKILRKSQNK